MDVIWLKRDVRWKDHGPLAAAVQRPTLLLYLYEPDQLQEPTVHGSHVLFQHEGLVDMERSIEGDHHDDDDDEYFMYLTVCHNQAVDALDKLHAHTRIHRIFSHQETGHWASYQRDQAVRKWCRQHRIPCIEFQQQGVTRCLASRDDFDKKRQEFVQRPCHPSSPKKLQLQRFSTRELHDMGLRPFPKRLDLNLFTEIPAQHRHDRPRRYQRGGEREALATLHDFLHHRCREYSAGISSPHMAWTSCSRLSTYLAWGHVSLRYVIQACQARQVELRATKDTKAAQSLRAFASRLHWRSHFIQKLESESLLEKRDLCPAYQALRRSPGDWNEAYYQAWASGKTGFPLVDACMRSLIRTGWLNFRMRAMLVSFATYNLWLDWKRIAPHLGRLFLDFEPGIHYPQLQMQAGTTGINAMRVYSVTKQAKDQDPSGIFIRQYVAELQQVPPQYIHEPWRMSKEVQEENRIRIVDSLSDQVSYPQGVTTYPQPIVHEQDSARVAKDKIHAIRNQSSTKAMAQQVLEKHGSRHPRREQMNGRKRKTIDKPSTAKTEKEVDKQVKISSFFSAKNDKATGTSWACTACTFINDNSVSVTCSMCLKPRKALVCG